MNTIQIVKNSDRCHVSVNGVRAVTFMYSNYTETKQANKEDHALHDARAQCFLTLAAFQDKGDSAKINTAIVTK